MPLERGGGRVASESSEAVLRSQPMRSDGAEQGAEQGGRRLAETVQVVLEVAGRVTSAGWVGCCSAAADPRRAQPTPSCSRAGAEHVAAPGLGLGSGSAAGSPHLRAGLGLIAAAWGGNTLQPGFALHI